MNFYYSGLVKKYLATKAFTEAIVKLNSHKTLKNQKNSEKNLQIHKKS